MKRSLPHPSVRTEHTPIDLTHTPLVFPLPGAQLHLSAGPHLPTPHATAAHGHTPNQHRFFDCSPCSSIHRECVNRVSHFHHSSHRPVSPLGPVPTHHHFVTHTSFRTNPQMKPKPLRSCVPRCGKSTGHSNNSILAHTSWHRLCFLDPCVKIARAILRTLKCVLSRRHLVGRFSRTRECKLSHRNCDSCKLLS